MMDESQYLALADKTFRKILDAFDNIDPDQAEAYMAGDVLTIAFANGIRCVINTQRPVRQVWLASRASAWHFDYNAELDRWVSDKDANEQLFATVREIVLREGNVTLALAH
ncbi:MAG: iron donor protein CyaY [Deltaproteobacteria bacterium]|nr:iron donor protein CyaY [Deltaproteobacteria bacterium]